MKKEKNVPDLLRVKEYFIITCACRATSNLELNINYRSLQALNIILMPQVFFLHFSVYIRLIQLASSYFFYSFPSFLLDEAIFSFSKSHFQVNV